MYDVHVVQIDRQRSKIRADVQTIPAGSKSKLNQWVPTVGRSPNLGLSSSAVGSGHGSSNIKIRSPIIKALMPRCDLPVGKQSGGW